MGDDPFADPPDPLLAPIPGPDPAGEDLRYDPIYDRIQEARREEDANAPQGIWSTKLKRADWAEVRDEAAAALAGRSKDLQLAAWLTEAWLQLDGLPGLTRGLRLLTSLSLRFWPVLFPKLDESDPETRLAPMYWVDGKLPARIGALAVTSGGGTDDAPLTWQEHASAQRLEPLAKSAPYDYQQAIDKGVVPLPKFNAAVTATRTGFFQTLGTNLQSAADALQALRTTLDELCGPDAPALSGLERALDSLALFVRMTLADRGIRTPEPDTAAAAPVPAAVQTASYATPGETGPGAAAGSGRPEAAPAAAATIVQLARGPITTRDEAYRVLAEAADFLMRTEPHSPTPYLIRRAVTWGRMSLSDLLRELIDEDGSRKPIERLLQLPDT